MKHITPIEEAVALAAIKKFRLHNQLEDENDESDPSPYTSDQDETGLSEAEEIEATDVRPVSDTVVCQVKRF